MIKFTFYLIGLILIKLIHLLNNDYLRKQFDIKPNKKIILYSGNIGEKQNLDSVINVAKKIATINE